MKQRLGKDLINVQLGLSMVVLIVALAAPQLAIAGGPEGKDIEQWRQALLEERAAKEQRLRDSPTSLLTGIDHIRHKVGDTVIVHSSDEGITFSATA